MDISTPASAAGTKPKADNALNRPPTFESPFTTLYPCPRDDLSSAVPESVTITMWSIGFKLSCFKSSSNNLRWEIVSIVVPDLDPMTMTTSDNFFGMDACI